MNHQESRELDFSKLRNAHKISSKPSTCRRLFFEPGFGKLRGYSRSVPPQIARGHTPVRRRTALAAPGSARLPRDRWRSEPRRGDSRSDEAGVCLLRPRVDLRISAPVRSPFDRRTNRVRTNRIPNRAWDDGRRGLAARAVGAVSERVVVPRRGDAPERGAVPRERRATRWFFHLAAEARGERRGGRAGARGRR